MSKAAALALTAASLALTLPLGAQPMQKPGAQNSALVKAGTYKVDPAHTLIKWSVDHMGFTPYFGLFGDVTGSLTIDPATLAAAKVDVTIPVAKITTASPALNAHLLKPAGASGKPDFFGAAPANARFVSTAVTSLGKGRARITGNLTLNGVTRPVVLNAAFYGAGILPQMMGGGDGLGFTATGKIMRSQFGIGFGIPVVSDEVALEISAAFVK